MRLHALAAVATLIVHLTSVGGGLVYLCMMDGRARTACCCPEGDERHAPERPAISSARCCEISAIAPNAVVGVSEKRAVADPVPSVAAAIPGFALAASSADVAVPSAGRDLPSLRSGPPRYLEIRTLII